MADSGPLGRTAGQGATHGVLQLLAANLEGCTSLLVASRPDHSISIEDAFPDTTRIGARLRVPTGLLGTDPLRFLTADARLALGWTELCGDRPDWIVTAPVRYRPLHVAVAGTGDAPPDLDAVAVAADVIGKLLNAGQITGREWGASLRVTALISHLPAPVLFVDSQDVQVFLNDRARRLLGVADNAEGPRIALALSRLVNGADDSDRQRRLAADPTASLVFEVVVDARRYLVDSRWVDQGDLTGRIWLFRDVTVERAVQAELSDVAGLLELTVENVGEGVMLVDEHRRIALLNHACFDLFDVPPELMDRGADFMVLMRFLAIRGDLGPGAPDKILAMIDRGLRKEEHGRREVQRADGRTIDIRHNALDGGRFLLTARDVTDEREAARFKDELVATVSHELRTPLTAITGSLGLMKAGLVGELPPAALNLIEVAHRNGARLGRLVDDLLDMDKLRAGKMEFAFADTDLHALLRDIVEQNTPYAEQFGVMLDLAMPAKIVRAEVDPGRLGQVLANLLSNASKFSPAGSVVQIRLIGAAKTVRISVIDRGRGMSAEFKRRLFTRFSQEDRSAERGQAGTGLGLAISKSIVDHHGGTIAVESMVGRGTTFHIDLPRRQPAAESGPSA